jgi:hypothetical protein
VGRSKLRGKLVFLSALPGALLAPDWLAGADPYRLTAWLAVLATGVVLVWAGPSLARPDDHLHIEALLDHERRILKKTISMRAPLLTPSL